jgi:hypothetical protein
LVNAEQLYLKLTTLDNSGPNYFALAMERTESESSKCIALKVNVNDNKFGKCDFTEFSRYNGAYKTLARPVIGRF